jgi:branched-chain amino acid transport system permease protein
MAFHEPASPYLNADRWSEKMRLRVFRNVSGTDLFMWLIGGSILIIVIYGSVSTLSSGRYSIENWLDFIVSGLAQGGVYALIALGYTLVYGILLMINFAHGEVFMSGAFTAYFVAEALFDRGLFQEPSFSFRDLGGLALVVLVAAVTSVVVAVILERVAYRPLRSAPRLVPLITAIGASFFLQYTFRGLYGSGVKTYPEVAMLKGDWTILGVSMLKIQVVIIVSALVMMLGLYWFVQRTKTGKAMRAVSEDKDVAALMGVDVDRVIVITFVVGAALAGAAGVLYALLFKQVQFFMGFIPGLKAFTAAVLGGIGNIPGAMLGGLFLGLAESLGPSLFLEGIGIPAAYQLKDVIAFTMLVLVLIFRPSGILGERLAQKKA